MCGITGCLAAEGEAPFETQVLRAAASLRHRGPDGSGLYVDRSLAMAATRLAIFDLEGGDPPLSSSDGRFWGIQNGEIYNHPELRAEMEERGISFRTSCDTEVLVNAYALWGPDCLERFEGVFAFAVWDRRERRLFLARDRFGVRPLFTALREGRFWFASEAGALASLPEVWDGLDPSCLPETFVTWGCGPDRSFFRGIAELPPGSCLELRAGEAPKIRTWWRPLFPGPGDEGGERVEDLVDACEERLRRAVRLRLRADVPVALYLSGGLDSSLVAALARQESSAPLHAFGLTFGDPCYDESKPQQRMAEALGLDLEVLAIEDGRVAEAFPEAVLRAEKPLLRTAPAPLFLLSSLAREHGLEVVLTGEGADELFAGYNLFRETAVRRFWARVPSSPIRPRLLERLYPYLARDLGRSAAFTRAFFRKGLTETGDLFYSHRIRFANTARCLRFLAPEIRDILPFEACLERLRGRLPEGFDEQDWLGRARSLEILSFLEPYLLHSQGDRMLMAHSVEGRFPFLAPPVAEFASRLPPRVCLAGLREKWILRKVAERHLPLEISARPKRPYRAPILGAFFGADAPSWVEDVLEDALRPGGFFDPVQVERLRKRCREKRGEGIGETDEMALSGILSTGILEERWRGGARGPSPLVPRRRIRGSEIDPPGGARPPGGKKEDA